MLAYQKWSNDVIDWKMFTLISGILVYFLSEISIIWFIFFIKGVRDNVSGISQQPSYDKNCILCHKWRNIHLYLVLISFVLLVYSLDLTAWSYIRDSTIFMLNYVCSTWKVWVLNIFFFQNNPIIKKKFYFKMHSNWKKTRAIDGMNTLSTKKGCL